MCTLTVLTAVSGGEPETNCRTSKYGCCWDAYTPRGDIYGTVGCPGKLTNTVPCMRKSRLRFLK